MQPEGCLQICLLGDQGVGHSAFLRCFMGDDSPADPIQGRVENNITLLELDGSKFRVRFTDNLGGIAFEGTRRTALSCAHAVLLCFAVNQADSLASLETVWYRELREADVRAPTLVVGCKSDLRLGFGTSDCASTSMAARVAQRHGAFHYLECSAMMQPESVHQVMDLALAAAKEYYTLQWQLSSRKHPYPDAGPDAEGPWCTHEAMTVGIDSTPLDETTIRESLSMAGATFDRRHAYLRADITDLGITSVEALRTYEHLQFVNVSGNRLRSLEPFGALRCLLHLNASLNLLVRTQSFAAPDQLETIDVSYNLIGEVGDWSVHKYLRELNLRGNFIQCISPGLQRNKELRILDLSENYISCIERLDGLQLRTLYLAQNRLASLAGVGSLMHLQVLNVRHNLITSLAQLQADELPRLRKLCVSENRLSRIAELDALQSFRYICDLFLAPNPVAELPEYRSQVLYRIPSLRLLDKEPVSAEEKVKAEVVYGADVENRVAIFKNLLPDEDFVDRRLVTRESIRETEGCRMYGGESDAGPYGFAEAEAREGGPGGRTPFQEAHFRHLLETVRLGAETLDVSSTDEPFLRFRVYDDDVPQLLEAAMEGGVRRLILGKAAVQLGTTGVTDILQALRSPSSSLLFVDLTGCQAVGQYGRELFSRFPFGRGCSMEAAGCGLSNDEVARLRNRTAEAQAAAEARVAERDREAASIAAYMAEQEKLEAFAERYCTRGEPPESSLPPYDPERWRFGPDCGAWKDHEVFVAANPRGAWPHDQDEANPWRLVGRDGSYVHMSGQELDFLREKAQAMLEHWDDRGEDVNDVWDEAFPDTWAPSSPASRDGFGEEDESDSPPPRRRNLSDANVNRHMLSSFMAWCDGTPAGSEAFRAWEREPEERMPRLREQTQLAEEKRRGTWARWQAYQANLTAKAKAAYDDKALPFGMASGQLIAHFTWLYSVNQAIMPGDPPPAQANLRLPEYFRLKSLAKAPRKRPAHGLDLHAALLGGQVQLEVATGVGFHITVHLRNNTDQTIPIVVRAGTVFQHVDWHHRQNLMVQFDYYIYLPPNDVETKKMCAYCMNRSCACSRGEELDLTDWYFEDPNIFSSQAHVWSHFEGAFGRDVHREYVPRK